MPIFEYACRSCGKPFELLVRSSTEPACPHCASTDLERLLSIPAIKSESTHGQAMAAARKRDEKQGREKYRAQRDYELKHND